MRVIRAAQMRHGASYPRVLTRLFDVYAQRGYSLGEIVKLDLLDPARTRDWLDQTASKRQQLDLQRRLNPRNYWVLTEDKNVFYPFCAGSGLPVPAFFGTIFAPAQAVPAGRAAQMREQAIHVFEQAGSADLIVKPAQGVYGIGVVALQRQDGALIDATGVRRTPGEVMDWLATWCEYPAFVVQQRLDAHPSLRALSGTKNLQTVRMATYVRRDGTPMIGCCQLKIIGGDSLVDNYGNGLLGNLIGDIPKAAGRLSNVHGAASDGSSRRFDRHPRTGIVFKGFEIPFWDDACALVRKAALAFLPLRTIGWDVAITPSGAVLIEGNVKWDPPQVGREVSGDLLEVLRADGEI